VIVQPHPSQDRTLLARRYLDAATLEREREVVFGTAWQLAGFAIDVEQPGSYATALLGDREFVVTRDGDGVLRAFHNVCPHRGAAVASGCGHRRTLQCPYHGWTFDLDGRLRRAPGMDAAGLGARLREVHVTERAGLLFVSAAPARPPFEEQAGGLFDHVAELGIDLPALISGGRRVRKEFEIAANWKVVMENSLECYHCGIAHPGIADSLDLDRYEHRIERWWSVQGAPMRNQGRGAETALGEASRTAAAEDGFGFSLFAFLYPNLFLEVYPGSASFAVLVVRPLGAGRTRSEHTKLVPPDVSDAELAEWDAFVDQVIREDVALCESVQRGLASGAIERGILNVAGAGANEACIGHFDALVAEALGET
jgi:choline monooxygenase